MAVQIAGSLNVDVIQSVSALPRPGETVLASGSVRLPGGKGANQAVAAARMGARTAMRGAVGDDDDGRWMCAQLSAAGVDTARIAILSGELTGAAYIAVDQGGENQIIVAPGANAGLTPAHLALTDDDIDGANDTDGANSANSITVRLAQLEIPVETVRAFFTAPRAPGCVRILNAAPALPEASSLFAHTDILVVNEHELALYLGSPVPQPAIDMAMAARQLITRDDQLVVVTLGAKGAMVVRRNSHLHIPSLPVVPRDTIGAGDCFTGALAALIDAGSSAEQALPICNAAAALCTQAQGAIPAMPTQAAVQAFLARGIQSARPS